MRSQYLIYNYFLVSLVLATGNLALHAQFDGINNPEYIRKVKEMGKTYDALLIYAMKDSVQIMEITGALRKYAIQTGDNQLAIEAEFLELNYLIKNTKVGASKILPRVITLVENADDSGDLYVQVKTRRLMADYYWWIREYEQSFEEYIRVNEMAEPLDKKHLELKSTIAYETGRNYFYF